MRNLICRLFHFSILILFLFIFMLLCPNGAAASPVPIPFKSSSLSSRILSHNHSITNDHSAECDALLRFSNSFTITADASMGFFPVSCDNSSYARTASWKEEGGSDCCLWDGVTCDPSSTSHVVIGLDLSCSWLQGPILSDSTLFSLPNLRRLNLAGNDFNRSEIPSKFGIFKEITHLNLSGSRFTGQIPFNMLSQLSELNSLDLSYSNLAMEADVDLGRVLRNLTQLRELVLDEVDLSRVDPMSLSNLSSSLTTLSLSYCNLEGTIPIDIFYLPNLRTLDLFDNSNVTGTLPETIWSSPLVFLDLSFAKFHGPIPASIGNLTSVEHLDLSYNNFAGPIPPTLGKLTHLVLLDLSGNNFNATTMDLLCDRNCSMPKLQHLRLGGCGVTRFPYFLNSSTELTLLDLSHNKIIEPIPEWFWRVTRDTLEILYFGSYSVTGEIPPSVCHMHSLTFIDLSSNTLHGSIPTCLGNLSSLEYLSLSHNLLHGPLPRSLENCTSLLSLDLQSNKFHGFINDIALPRQLSEFWLSHNSFVGPLPIPPPTIQYYDISNNKFSGGIPHNYFCNFTILAVIDLSYNSLTGSIPQCFSNFNASLIALDLRANKFVGYIPDIFNHNIQMQTIRLSQNSMHGELPRSLANCKNLEILDVSGNELEGHFPYWLDTLPNLKVISLRSNRFYGSVGSLSRIDRPFPKLRILDLSNNNFSGPVPVKYIASFIAMKNLEDTGGSLYMSTKYVYYEDSIEIVIKGSENELERILTIFTAIDLSRNSFDGEIPDAIGDLKVLKGLNFSHNNLTGNIPSNLGNLTNLEWLDLSSNKLNGDIPRELALLSSLEFLNLSNNQLVGQIPRSTQFDTFTSDSFGGNPGLCGHPLPKSCDRDAGHKSPSTSHEEEETGSGSWIEWRAVVTGYGCGLALAISAWYIMMETRRPWWLVGTIERWSLRIVKGKTLGRKTNRPSSNSRQRMLVRMRTRY